MKIFVAFLVAAIICLGLADSSLPSGHNHNVQQAYYMEEHQQQHQQQAFPQQQQSQYASRNVISNSILKPSIKYLPQPQHPMQLQHNQRYVASQKPQPIAVGYPMPNGFPTKLNVQSSVKPVRRYRPRIRIPKKTIVTKNFYVHSAPEETQSEIDEELASLQPQPRKHYNVLFVKTPSEINKAAAFNLARAVKEEKTVVYVLAKKTSAADLQDAIEEAPQYNSKPEVFFIKYRTPEEAANAQLQIQTQYDSLGGSSTISDEGIAPATSVVGSLDASEEEEEEEEQPQEQQLDNSQETVQTSDHHDEQESLDSHSSSSSSSYLPPSDQY